MEVYVYIFVCRFTYDYLGVLLFEQSANLNIIFFKHDGHKMKLYDVQKCLQMVFITLILSTLLPHKCKPNL